MFFSVYVDLIYIIYEENVLFLSNFEQQKIHVTKDNFFLTWSFEFLFCILMVKNYGKQEFDNLNVGGKHLEFIFQCLASTLKANRQYSFGPST